MSIYLSNTLFSLENNPLSGSQVKIVIGIGTNWIQKNKTKISQ